jgi:hypothetical protein
MEKTARPIASTRMEYREAALIKLSAVTKALVSE